MNRRRALASGAGAVALPVIAAAGWLRPAPAPVGPAVGQHVPDFRLPLLHDAARSLSSADLRGQAWVMVVWASWCAPCRQEQPLLMAAARTSGLRFVGLDYRDDPRDGQEWLRELGDPCAWQASDREGRASAACGVEAVPATLVIDAGGVLQHRHVGPLTAAHWQAVVRPLLQRLAG